MILDKFLLMINQKQELREDRLFQRVLQEFRFKNSRINSLEGVEPDQIKCLQHKKQDSGKNKSSICCTQVKSILREILSFTRKMEEQFYQSINEKIVKLEDNLTQLGYKIKQMAAKSKFFGKKMVNKIPVLDYQRDDYLERQFSSLRKQIQSLGGKVPLEAGFTLQQYPSMQFSPDRSPRSFQYNSNQKYLKSPISTVPPTPQSSPWGPKQNQLIIKQYAKQIEIKDMEIERNHNALKNVLLWVEQIRSALQNLLPCQACRLREKIAQIIGQKNRKQKISHWNLQNNIYDEPSLLESSDEQY